MKINEIIRSTRTEMNLSQMELAERAGVTAPTISRIELTPEKVQMGSLMKVCEVLKLHISIKKLL